MTPNEKIRHHEDKILKGIKFGVPKIIMCKKLGINSMCFYWYFRKHKKYDLAKAQYEAFVEGLFK